MINLVSWILTKRNLSNQKKYIRNLCKRGMKLGSNTDIINSQIDWGYCYLIEIGDNTTITHASILAHDASTKKFVGYTKVGKVKIGNYCFIGCNSIVLPGVTVGNNVIIGAGTVVRNNIEDGMVVYGNPAKIICTTEEYINKNKEKMQNYPIWDIDWRDKSEEEIRDMQQKLEHSMGFDI